MIQKADVSNLVSIAELATKLWGTTLEEQLSDCAESLATEGILLLLCVEEDRPVGFAQCCIRFDFLEGGDGSPVGYLDGLFVEPEFRRKGYGTQLLRACEDWARENGCSQFTSEAETSNDESVSFHDHSGFSEIGHIICYAKPL